MSAMNPVSTNLPRMLSCLPLTGPIALDLIFHTTSCDFPNDLTYIERILVNCNLARLSEISVTWIVGIPPLLKVHTHPYRYDDHDVLLNFCNTSECIYRAVRRWHPDAMAFLLRDSRTCLLDFDSARNELTKVWLFLNTGLDCAADPDVLVVYHDCRRLQQVRLSVCSAYV